MYLHSKCTIKLCRIHWGSYHGPLMAFLACQMEWSGTIVVSGCHYRFAEAMAIFPQDREMVRYVDTAEEVLKLVEEDFE